MITNGQQQTSQLTRQNTAFHSDRAGIVNLDHSIDRYSRVAVAAMRFSKTRTTVTRCISSTAKPRARMSPNRRRREHGNSKTCVSYNRRKKREFVCAQLTFRIPIGKSPLFAWSEQRSLFGVQRAVGDATERSANKIIPCLSLSRSTGR